MQRFVKTFIVPLLGGKRWRSVCEIGASLGDGTGIMASIPAGERDRHRSLFRL